MAVEVDFALIGHLETWSAAADVLATLRGPELTPIPDEDVREILPWIPARAVCHVDIESALGRRAHGLYVDSFIAPDRLDSTYLRENLKRVQEAAACAVKAGAKIVSLGGFSSILIEGNLDRLPGKGKTAFTTGNTLTVAFIVEGMQRMCMLKGKSLAASTLLIVGATGDVGSGCARCLSPLVKRVILFARNEERLRRLAQELHAQGVDVEITIELDSLLNQADLVVCAASLASPTMLLHRLRSDAIVCDAGYPKNLASRAEDSATIFLGGLGRIMRGLSTQPDIHRVLSPHPSPDVVQGCLLEGVALALEQRYESYSQGRGNITKERVNEIREIASRHGIVLAPLHNAAGPLE